MAPLPPIRPRATSNTRPRTLSAVEIANLARDAGFRDDRPSNDRYAGRASSELAVAVAVALAESSGKTDARNRISGATGLWQIYPGSEALKDPATNARAAWTKYTANGRRFGRGPASSCLWSAFCSGRYRAKLGAAERAVKSTHRDRPFVTRPGALADSAFGWIGDLFGNYVVPVLKVAGGGVLVIVALAGAFAVMALGREPGAPNPLAPARTVARIRPGGAERAERARIRARNRSELARVRVESRVTRSGRERVKIVSRREGRRRIQEEADREAANREERRRDRPRRDLRVIEGVGPGAKGRRRSA